MTKIIVSFVFLQFLIAILIGAPIMMAMKRMVDMDGDQLRLKRWLILNNWIKSWKNVSMMMNDETTYFMWIEINGKFWPSKLYGDYQSKLRRALDSIVFKKELRSDEKDLTLDQLVVKYPIQKRKEND